MARDSNQTTNLGRRTSQTCMFCWFLGMKQNMGKTMGLDSSPESDLFSWKRTHQRQISLEGLLGRTKPNHLEPSQDVKNGLCFKVLDRPCNNGPWIGRFGTAIGNIWELRAAAEAPARTASRRKLRFGVPNKKNNSILVACLVLKLTNIFCGLVYVDVPCRPPALQSCQVRVALTLPGTGTVFGRFTKMAVPPKSSILIGCSVLFHPFWDTPIYGTPPRNRNDQKKD